MKNVSFTQKALWTLILAPALVWPGSARAINGKVSVIVHKEGSDTPLPCRAWIEIPDIQRRYYRSQTKSCITYDRDRSFSCDGHFVVEVPANRIVIHVERGKEYFPVDQKAVVHENKTTEVDITLKRWVNMVDEGWYSMDIHCHFGHDAPKVLKQTALADDVNMEPILSIWHHRQTEPPKSKMKWKYETSIYADPTHLITFRNQEIERISGAAFESVGALLMMGLNQPVQPSDKITNYPCDVSLSMIAKKDSPDCLIDADKPNWGENVIGMALGLFDSVQLCHNHYHRSITMPLGWGMADASLEEEKKDWGDENDDTLFHITNSMYYRFLNCGFILHATGGSAMGVMRVPLGYNRTYAKLDGPLTEANYINAVKAGRTFATSGPILIMTANGLDVGSTIKYSSKNGDPIKIKAQLRSIQQIDSLELIHNGRVVKKIELTGQEPSPVLNKTVELPLKPRRSGWVAARAIFKSPDKCLRQAHTSPIYIVLDGKPTASKGDALYMIRWIDKILEVSKKPGRYDSDEQRNEVQSIFNQARSVYQNIAQKAQQVWGD
ncbi:MAG: CehA/McbA family metallohydrolase [Planctomycetota bacterium]|jgi:hypothetical protein